MPGVHTVVADKDFGGVVADSRAKARAAVNQLEVAWEPGRLWQQAELEAIVTVGNGNGVTIQDEGDAEGKLREETTLTAEYRTPFAIHAHLEAQAALADVQPDKVRIWCSTQAQGLVRSGVAKALGVKEEIVEVFPTYVGGGFGRKTGADAAVEAARLAKAAGVPVHVGWTREEDMRYGYFRPLTHHMLAGRLDANGNLIALEHRQASGDVAFDFLPGFLSAVMGADFGAYRGARIRYAVPNKRTVAWRTPAAHPHRLVARPGAAGQHLCRGVLHGRTGSQRRGRPGGVSAASPPGRRSFPAAHEGRDPGRCRKGWVGRTAAGRACPGHRRHAGRGHGGRRSGRNLPGPG